MSGKRLGRREKLAQKVGRRVIYSPVPPPSKLIAKGRRVKYTFLYEKQRDGI